jgi:hypothetical protein
MIPCLRSWVRPAHKEGNRPSEKGRKVPIPGAFKARMKVFGIITLPSILSLLITRVPTRAEGEDVVWQVHRVLAK